MSGPGQADPVDAVAIARITAREPSLPPVRPMTGHAADLRVLTEYRDRLVNERTATANRVHTDLLWLRPGHQHQLPHLTNTAHLHAALELLSGDDRVRAAVSRTVMGLRHWCVTGSTLPGPLARSTAADGVDAHPTRPLCARLAEVVLMRFPHLSHTTRGHL